MIAGLQRLLVELREEGLAVSPAEWIDAMRAVEHVGVAERELLRAALGATLAKRVAHREVFDRVFDRVFAAPARGAGKKKGQRGGGGAPAKRPSPASRGMGKGQVVRPDSRSLVRFARLGQGSESRPGRLRKVVLAPLEDREAERARAHGMAARAASTLLRPQRRVVSLDAERELAQKIPRLVSQIRLRTGRRHARAARGRLDLRRTFRENLGSGGVPFVLPRRRPRPKGSKLWLLVDVSWSTAAAAGLFLSVAAEFLLRSADTRVFLFVDRAVEAGPAIERWWASRPGAPLHSGKTPGSAIARGGLSFAELLASVPGLALDAPSDYGRTFSGLLRERPLGRGTLLVVLGDGRSNLLDPQAWAFEELARGAGAVLWLVPEPLSRWAEGDSALEQYLPHADVAVEARDAEGLARGVGEIVRRLGP